jgi:hypothetical protein
MKLGLHSVTRAQLREVASRVALREANGNGLLGLRNLNLRVRRLNEIVASVT